MEIPASNSSRTNTGNSGRSRLRVLSVSKRTSSSPRAAPIKSPPDRFYFQETVKIGGVHQHVSPEDGALQAHLEAVDALQRLAHRREL